MYEREQDSQADRAEDREQETHPRQHQGEYFVQRHFAENGFELYVRRDSDRRTHPRGGADQNERRGHDGRGETADLGQVQSEKKHRMRDQLCRKVFFSALRPRRDGALCRTAEFRNFAAGQKGKLCNLFDKARIKW